MANKKSTKKVKQGTAPAAATAASKANAKKADVKKAVAKKGAPAKKSSKKNAKPGFFGSIIGYFKAVRSEMKRVVWPTKNELVNYSIAVIASLIVVGVVIAALDAVVSQGLVLFSGLRG